MALNHNVISNERRTSREVALACLHEVRPAIMRLGMMQWCIVAVRSLLMDGP
jgi:hypothetical protein